MCVYTLVCMYVVWNTYFPEATSVVNGAVKKKQKKNVGRRTMGSRVRYARPSNVSRKSNRSGIGNRATALKFDFAFRFIFSSRRNTPNSGIGAFILYNPECEQYLFVCFVLARNYFSDAHAYFSPLLPFSRRGISPGQNMKNVHQ